MKISKRNLNVIAYYKNLLPNAEKVLIQADSGYSQGKYSSGWVASTGVYIVTNSEPRRCFSGKTDEMIAIAKAFNLPIESKI